MKKSLVCALMVLLVVGTLVGGAWARNTGDAAIRGQVQTYFDAIAEKLDKKDIDGVAQNVIPGATLRYANGKEITIEEWKQATAKEFAEIATIKSKFRVEKVISRGDTRIVTYRETHNYLLKGEKKRMHRSVSRWSVTLANTPQGWKAAHFFEFYEKQTVGGRQLKPKAPPKK